MWMDLILTISCQGSNNAFYISLTPPFPFNPAGENKLMCFNLIHWHRTGTILAVKEKDFQLLTLKFRV
jgi:hypothetical protein